MAADGPLHQCERCPLAVPLSTVSDRPEWMKQANMLSVVDRKNHGIARVRDGFDPEIDGVSPINQLPMFGFTVFIESNEGA